MTLDRIELRSGTLERGDRPDGFAAICWPGARIPEDVREAVAAGRLLELGGAYGDREAANPAEYDHLRLVAGGKTVDIEVFNRGLAILAGGDERLRLLHRVIRRLDEPAVRRLADPVEASVPPSAVAEPVLRGSRHLVPSGADGLPSSRDLRASIAAFTEQLRCDPGDVRALEGRATAFLSRAFRGGQGAAAAARQAESDFGDVTRLDPGLAQGWQGRASARFHRARLEPLPRARRAALLRESIADYDEALKRLSGAFSVLLGRCTALRELAAELGNSPEAAGVWNEALAGAAAAVNAQPSSPEAYAGRAAAHLGLGGAILREGRDPLPDFEAGVADYERAQALYAGAPGCAAHLAVARAHLAILRARTGVDPSAGLQRALAEISSVPAFGPKEIDALEEISTILRKCAEASGGVMRGVILANLFAARARTARARGVDPSVELAQALAAVDDAAGQEPGNAQLLLMRANFLVPLGRAGEAIGALEEALRMDPGLDAARTMLEILKKATGGS